MIVDDMLVSLAGKTSLTPADIEGLKACDNASDLALLMRAYDDAGKVADRGVWSEIGAALLSAEQYAPLATLILAAIPLL